MNYKRAFKCQKCPQSNTEDGCPCWIELVETNAAGEERLTKTCLFPYFPRLVVELIKASNRPAAAVDELRKDIQILSMPFTLISLNELPQGPNRKPLQKVLEDGS